MASSTVRVIRRTTRYRWPDVQLNIWLIIFLVGSCTILGVHANFMTIQGQLGLGTPWYFPFWVATGSLGILYVLIMIGLTANRQLIPGVVMVGAFILFVLFLTGLVRDSIELWGPTNSVNSNCNRYIQGQRFEGVSLETLAFMSQNNICEYLRDGCGNGTR